MKAILDKTPLDHPDYALLVDAIKAVEGSVRTVNASFTRSNQWLAELGRISRELGLGDTLTSSPSRELILQGDFMQGRSSLRVYLLSDLMVVAEWIQGGAGRGKGEPSLQWLATIPLIQLWCRMEKVGIHPFLCHPQGTHLESP